MRIYYSIILFLALFAKTVAAQSTSFSYSGNEVKLLDVFSYIENNSSYKIAYSDSYIDVKKKVNINVKNAGINVFLNKLFGSTNIGYKIKNNSINLFDKSAFNSNQKSITITGEVRDEKNLLMPGVSVFVEGTTTGTVTDLDGKYSIKAKTNSTLVFSFIGYTSQKVAVNNRTKINISLSLDVKVMNEVVVTAMGIKRKAKSLTYATQTITGKELTRAKDANFINSLQGKSAGLVITPNAGGAGSASKILLRGNSSIEGNNSPLIVVDGIPLSNNVSGQFDAKSGGYKMAYAAASEGSDALSSINPDDIASITVLKGANAAALYGSEAANGVVMIKTKQGAEGKTKINVSSGVMFDSPLILPELQNVFGADLVNGGLSANSWGIKISEQNEQYNKEGISRTSGNDIKDFFNVGTNFTNSISFSGGTKKVQSYFSYANTASKGIIPGNKFNRDIFSLRQNYSFLKKNNLKLKISVNYVNQRINNRAGGGTFYNPIFNLYLAPRNIDMGYYKNNYEKDGEWFANPIKIVPVYKGGIGKLEYYKEDFVLRGMRQNWFQGKGVPGANNPYWLTNRNLGEYKTNRIYGTFALSYDWQKFNFQYRFNYNTTKEFGTNKVHATLVDPSGQYIDRGTYGETRNKKFDYFSDLLITYKTKIEDFDFSITSGGSFEKQDGDHFWMRNFGPSAYAYYTDEEQLPTTINVFYPNVSYYTQRQYNKFTNWQRALFATTQIGFRDKIFLDASYRVDWSRAFTQFKTAGIKDYYGYYSVGANALINELVTLPTVFNRVKMRISYSEVGNSIPNVLYSQQKYDPATGRVESAKYTGFDHPLPETVRSLEYGLDVAMFDEKLNFDITLYSTTMFNQYLPITSSIGSIKPINTGKVRNKGVEFTINYNMIPIPDFYWKTGVNFSYNDNEILKTFQNRKDIYIGIGTSDNLRVKFIEGGSYGDMYAKDFTRLKKFDIEKLKDKGITDYKEGDIKLSADGTPTLDAKGGHNVYLGNMNSDYTLGWSNTFKYKGVRLYCLIDGRIGGKVVSFTEAYLDAAGVSQRTADARTSGLTTTVNGETVPATVMPDGHLAGAYQYYYTVGNNIFPTEYVYDATNFRIRELSLGYTFSNLLGAGKNLDLSLIARNLMFLYNKAPIDPDISLSTQNALGGIDIFNMPSCRSFGINLKANF